MELSKEINIKINDLDQLKKEVRDGLEQIKKQKSLEKNLIPSLLKKKFETYAEHYKKLLEVLKQNQFIEKNFEDQYLYWNKREEKYTLFKLSSADSLKTEKGIIYYKDSGVEDNFQVFQYTINSFNQNPTFSIKIPLARYQIAISNDKNFKAIIESRFLLFHNKNNKFQSQYFPELQERLQVLYCNSSINKQLILEEIKSQERQISKIESNGSKDIDSKLKVTAVLGIIALIILCGLGIAGISLGLGTASIVVTLGLIGGLIFFSALSCRTQRKDIHDKNNAINILKGELKELKTKYESEIERLSNEYDPTGFKQKIHGHIVEFASLERQIDPLNSPFSLNEKPLTRSLSLPNLFKKIKEEQEYFSSKKDEFQNNRI